MAITYTTRLGLIQWGAGTDPVSRAQFNATFADIEDKAAFDKQSTAIARPSAGVRGTWHYATDTGQFARDDGSNWISIPSLPVANVFTAKQSIRSDTQSQFFIETATAANAAQIIHRRRTTADGSTYTEGLIESTANVWRVLPRKDSTSGITSNLSGMEGRWALNWGSDSAPSELFVIRSKAGSEVARFTEGGFLGLGTTSPVYRLDAYASSGSIPVARFGASTQEYALLVTPRGASRATLTFGADLNTGVSTARATTAGQLDVNGNTVAFYGDTGLTSGNSYTPTKRWEIDTNGIQSIKQGHFGDGSLTAGNPYAQIGNVGNSNTAFVKAIKSSGDAHMTLVSQNLGTVRLQPAGFDALIAQRVSNGNISVASPGWFVSGATIGVGDGVQGTQYPATKSVRISDVANGSGACETLHNLGISAQRICSVQSWVRGPNGEAVAMKTTAFNGDRIYAQVWDYPNAGYSGRPVIHYVTFGETAGYWP